MFKRNGNSPWNITANAVVSGVFLLIVLYGLGILK